MAGKRAHQPRLAIYMCSRFAMVGRLRSLPHAPGTEQIPLPLPAGSVLDLWPAAIGAPEAIVFYIQDRMFDYIAFNGGANDPRDAPGGAELDYILQCVSRAHWRAVSRWRE